ncbi:MAG TPA: ComF family protein [Patescibacteria group bacterium]|nr:ComF family protein [Patescibacteria group bacterium]
MYQTWLKPLFADVKAFVLDTLFPMTCLGCGREGSFLCSDCSALLPRVEYQRCIACQKPTPFGLTHPGCLSPQGADGLISCLDYHDPAVSKIIIRGKYYFLPGVYALLGRLLAEYLKANYAGLLAGPSAFVLVPIPLAPARRRWRGFNQAEILCEALAAELSLPVCRALVRHRRTRTQKDLKREQRLANMAGAFSINHNLKPEILNRNLLLVDDVTTTGATLLEAAKVLKRNGAGQVFCLTVARD